MTDRFNNSPLSDQGASIREYDFDQPAVNVGSHPDNDVILSGSGVMPFHATFIRQNGSFNIVPMAPDAGISLEGRLQQTGSINVKENQSVELGEFSVFLQKGPTPNSVHLTVFKGGTTAEVQSSQSTADGEQSILVNVLSQQSEVEVNQSAQYEFEIVNAGQIVAGFHISIQGVPSDWVQITPRVVNLNEGQRAIVRASITPPRAPSSAAGKHPISLVVTSPNYPRSRSVTQTEITIRPYYDFALGNLSPRQSHVRWKSHKADVNLPITNLGNDNTSFNAMAIDEENGCSFDFVISEDTRLTRQANMNIAAGESMNLPVEIFPSKQPLIALRNKRYHYSTTLQIPGQAVSPQTVSGLVINHPLLGWWAVLLTILLVVVGIFFLLQPRINSYQVASGKNIIELGDTTSLEWSVSPFANRLSISNVDKEITRSMKHLTVAPTQSTTYELVAGNWLSGMLGMDRKKSLTVLVVPPTPNISFFEVDKTEVDKGAPIKIRWSVTDADKVVLTIDEVIYELNAEEYSGERSVVLEKDSVITLEASNLSGSQLRSEFVNVVPPHITITKFTVWVKTAEDGTTASVAPSSISAHMASILPADRRAETTGTSDFPYKFVELIADDSSDTGYRVQFYQPERELDKGEQVMLEWEVDGVDTVTIAPFAETLPSKGKQPYFPQESMNFVLTAQSGELEQLFMLPVSVFDGEPPTAPTIDFFKAVPTKLTGGGSVQFSWSVSGDWTHLQLAKGSDSSEVIVADWINPQGFKTVKVSSSSTYLLKAWNGTLSTASPLDITVNPSLIAIALNIVDVYTDAGRFMVGDKLTVTIGFNDIPEGSPKPTGKVTVTDGYSSCTITLPALSCDLTFNTPGTKQLTASYEGDTIYLQDDSPAFSQKIVVESAQVELIPNYYDNEDVFISDITDSTNSVEMDKGLHIMVEVRPVNISIPDDEMSKVDVSVCDQTSAGVMIKDTCKFIGGEIVKPATEETFGRTIGLMYADIDISKFTKSGTKLLLFNYSHEENAIEPMSMEQPNVHIGKIKFHLSSSICETDEDALTGCELGAEDPSDTTITFNFRTADPNANILSSLPSPVASAFTFSAVGKTGAPATTWSCKTEVLTGVYKLTCAVKGMDSAYNPYTVTYSFDNSKGDSYFMQDQNTPVIKTGTFQLDVLENTKIVYEDVNTIYVGQEVQFTGDGDNEGFVSIQNSTGAKLNGELILTETSGANAATFACASATNCDQDDTTGAITILDAKADSAIVFKKSGSITIKSTYEGNVTDYLPTSLEKTLTVSKLEGITATWYGQYGASSWPTSVVVNNAVQARIVLGMPTVTGYTLNGAALVGRYLMVKFSDTVGITDCMIGAASSGTDGEYLVEITWDTSTSKPVADFSVTCGSTTGSLPYTVKMETAFVNVDPGTEGDDLELDPLTNLSAQLTVQSSSSTSLGVSIIRTPTSASGHTNLVNDSNSTLGTFHVGEKYAVQFIVSPIYGYYKSEGTTYTSNAAILAAYMNGDNYVNITLPPGVENAIDWDQSTCGTANNVRVRLNRSNTLWAYNDWSRKWNWGKARWDYTYWGGVGFELYSDPCNIVFGSDITVNQNSTFSFTSMDSVYTDTNVYMTPGISKQNLSMTFTPTSPYTGVITTPQTITIDLASTTNTDTSLFPIQSNVTDFTKQFSTSISCGTISDQKINSTKQAQFTLSSDEECLSQTLTVSYIQNKYFNGLLNQSYTYTFNKHASVVSLEYKNGSTWTSTFPFGTANAVKSTDYTFRVFAADNDNLNHSAVPDGTVRVKASGGTYTIKNSSNQAVAADANGYYNLVVNAQGYAEFTINFSDAVSNINLTYDYTGSDTFAASASKTTATFSVQ